MTKEVMVTLSGLQLGDSGEDTVETVHIGEYYEKNGVHYLFFDDMQEGHKTTGREAGGQKTRTSVRRAGL